MWITQITYTCVYIQRLKITILGANWQLFRLERIAKCSYFILSTQNIKFHWIVMKMKKFLLPIWWYNGDLFPLRNKYNVVLILNGLISYYIVVLKLCCTIHFMFITCMKIMRDHNDLTFIITDTYYYHLGTTLYRVSVENTIDSQPWDPQFKYCSGSPLERT